MVLDVIRGERRNPLPAAVSTVAVPAALWERLDAACPEWRWEGYAGTGRAFAAGSLRVPPDAAV